MNKHITTEIDNDNRLQFLKYLFIGGSAALLDFSMFMISLNVLEKMQSTPTGSIFSITPAGIANTLGIIVGFLWSFLLNKYWAFRAKGNSTIQFFLVLLLVVFNTAVTSILIGILHYHLLMPPELAKIILQITVVGWNYLIYRHLIFKNV